MWWIKMNWNAIMISWVMWICLRIRCISFIHLIQIIILSGQYTCKYCIHISHLNVLTNRINCYCLLTHNIKLLSRIFLGDKISPPSGCLRSAFTEFCSMSLLEWYSLVISFWIPWNLRLCPDRNSDYQSKCQKPNTLVKWNVLTIN